MPITVAATAVLTGSIAFGALAAGDQSTVDAPAQESHQASRSSDRPINPAILLEPPSSLATKKKVDEEVRELLHQTDELDEESDEDLRGDAPLPPPPEPSR